MTPIYLAGMLGIRVSALLNTTPSGSQTPYALPAHAGNLFVVSNPGAVGVLVETGGDNTVRVNAPAVSGDPSSVYVPPGKDVVISRRPADAYIAAMSVGAATDIYVHPMT